ncbi:MAG TPA: type II secretion system F family protein [Acidimicrobiales bacterium]|nr:type II secretion system F family protein [Acidimicrobiales bacterium]
MIPAVLAATAVLACGALARAAFRLSRRDAVARRLPGGSSPSDVGTADAAPSGRGRWKPIEPPARVGAALSDAALPLRPAVAWTAWLAALGLGPVVAAVAGGPGLAGVVGIGLAAGPVLIVRSRRGGAGARLEQALPGALESVARSLRSGASLRQAVEEAGGARASGPQLAVELSRAAAEAAQGASLVTALEGIAARRPLPGVRLGVAALCLGAETGGAQARAVDGVAATVRERLAVAAELRALSSQARISALVIGLAPVGFGGFAAATDPRTSQFLLHTPAGLGLLSAGLTLDGLGWLWMQRLARVDV